MSQTESGVRRRKSYDDLCDLQFVPSKLNFNFYRNYKLMSTAQTPVCVVSENGLGVFMV